MLYHPMSEPQRPINTFYAFCSLLLPGLGQLLQKRSGAAFGFCLLFLLTGFLPVLIVSHLFMDRFAQETHWVNILHVLVFVGICFPAMLAFFCAVIDAAAWKPGDRTRFKPYTIVGGILFAIVAVGLLLPSFPAAREAAKCMQCSNQMKQIGLAFQAYQDKHGHFPPAYTVDEEGRVLHCWRVLILPYIEENTLYEKIRLDEPWDSEYNRQFHAEVPSMFRCPSNILLDDKTVPVPGGCSYSVITGESAAFNGSEPRKGEDITGGTSNTIFLVERRIPVNWMYPSREMTFETACEGINVNALGISSYHSGGASCTLGDGSVRFVANDVDNELLQTLLTIDEVGTLL